MNRKNFFKSLSLVTMIVATKILSVKFFQPAWTNLTPNLPLTLEQILIHPSPINTVNFDPPPTDGDPKGTSGGASRSQNSCVLEPQWS